MAAVGTSTYMDLQSTQTTGAYHMPFTFGGLAKDIILCVLEFAAKVEFSVLLESDWAWAGDCNVRNMRNPEGPDTFLLQKLRATRPYPLWPLGTT